MADTFLIDTQGTQHRYPVLRGETAYSKAQAIKFLTQRVVRTADPNYVEIVNSKGERIGAVSKLIGGVERRRHPSSRSERLVIDKELARRRAQARKQPRARGKFR